ncbi:YojF family protein [Alicyclobacillus macrosporangiidus]|uniref:YojF family protein n=1 Tax=Alicyclobacillus macrosporangiidus TaxID=392015 RepID=UPI00049631B2|nr:YojF family protein [Alicyclobacillus macrosporangiidus]MCL6601063.1 YojF family protein [Alicyclobacillus macrosporangiidus]
MGPIDRAAVQSALDRFAGKDVYLHLETTNGAYAARDSENAMAICAYIRNGLVRYQRGVIRGDGPYRVGLKMENGWIYAEGLTDWEVDAEGRLLMAGHDAEGRLAIALELSETPFRM